MNPQTIKKQEASALLIVSLFVLLFQFSDFLSVPPASADAQEEWVSDVRINSTTAGTQRGNFITRTSAGDFIVIWQDAVSFNHFAQKINTSGTLQWGGDVQLTNINGADFMDVVADGSGGVFYMYASGGNLYVNHIDSSGAIWQTNGFQIYNDQVNDSEGVGGLLYDGSGGVYAVWPVTRLAAQYVDVTRLSSTGSVHASWNTGGAGTFRPVEYSDTTTGFEPRIVDGGTGDIIITYEAAANAVISRKLDNTGAAVWGPTTTSNGFGIDGWMTIPDDSSGVLIGYNSRNNFPYDMKISKVDNTGTAAWTTTVGTANNASPYPHMISNGSGDASMFWNHEDDGSGDVDIYGQQVNTDGVAQWNGGSMMAVANSSAPYSETLLYDINHSIAIGGGGVFIGFAAVGGDNPVGIQFINADGTKGFGTNGYYLGFKGWYITMAGDGSGGVIGTWTGTETAVSTDYDIWAQRLTYTPPAIAPEGAIEIHIVDNVTGSASATGGGVSNGDDAGSLADINFTGAPTAPNANISGAERYSFSAGAPTQSSIATNFESLAGTEFPSSGGGNLRAQDDAVSTAIPLGFTTQIYGKNVDTVVVSSNGFVYLNSSTDMTGTADGCCDGFSMSNYPNLPASVNGTATGDILIAGKWTDLNPGGEVTSSVRYSTDGTAPDRRFVITFEDVRYFDPSPLPLNDFQINILETAPAGGGGSSQSQSGTLPVTCSPTAPSFTVTPAATFNFYLDGSSGTIYSSSSQQTAFNNPNGAGLGNSAGEDYIQIRDVRDPSDPGCNDGLNLTVAVRDGTDADGIYFDDNPSGAGGNFIPLENLMVVSSNDNCPAGTTATANGVCFDNNALCGDGDNNPAITCASTDGSTSVNYDGNQFGDFTTFAGDGAVFGLTNTPNVTPTSVIAFSDGNELFGDAGLATAYGMIIPAGQPSGSYVVEIEYTLTGL